MAKKVIPFLKWAGGKRWLTSRVGEFFPAEYNTYIEPFLGSAAIYFSLLPERAILSDINPSLINTYSAIKDDWEAVYNALVVHSNNHNYDYYYQIRETNYTTPSEQAARFIYLNRTCFNGIYRVNQQGKFNVPKGSKNKVLLDTDNFRLTSETLENAEILNSDFEAIVDRAVLGDLIYVDPPYTVKHNDNGFMKYNEKMFTWDDQERLARALIRAKNRGATVVVSNADHLSLRELYATSDISSLDRSSVIASDPDNRGTYSEILVRL